MPVVRELVNRISFKVNPADKKNAESAMDKMGLRAKGLIGIAAGIGKAFAAAFIGATALGLKSFREFERDTAKINFFARNQEEADKLLSIFDKLAAGTDTISQRQSRAANSILATIALTTDQVSQLAPFIKDLSLARPDLGMEGIANAIKAISQGDLGAFAALVPGFKDAAAILEKTDFGKTFGSIVPEQRIALLLSELGKKSGRLAELAQAQLLTLDNSINTTTAQTSDIIRRLGEEAAEPMKEVLALVNEALKALKESEEFWTALRITFQTIADTIKLAVAIAKAGKAEDEALRRQQGTEEGGFIFRSPNAPISQSTPSGLPSMKEVGTGLQGINQGGLALVIADAIKSVFSGGGSASIGGPNAPIDINVNLTNSNGEVVNVKDQSAIKVIVEAAKNITAKNGGRPFP